MDSIEISVKLNRVKASIANPAFAADPRRKEWIAQRSQLERDLAWAEAMDEVYASLIDVTRAAFFGAFMLVTFAAIGAAIIWWVF